MTGYTKGPYGVTKAKAPRDGEYDYAIGADIGGTIYVIAEVFGRVADDVCPNAEDTAHLIAAAPDMYEALKAANKLMEHMGDTLNAMDVVTKEDAAKGLVVFNEVTAAISKAEGKT